MRDALSARGRNAYAPTAASGGAFVSLFLFLTLCLPSFVLSLPGLPEYLRTTDMVGAFLLVAYLFAGGRVGEGERYLLLFLTYLILVSVASLMILNLNPRLGADIGLPNILYTVRAIFIYAPALAAFHLNASPRIFARLGYRWMAAGVLFTLFIMAAYAAGSTSFNAQQTLEMGTIRNWTTRVHRLGGIVGESGAFAFHALLVMQLLIFFTFLSDRAQFGRLLLTLFLPYVTLVFYLSQTRIILVTSVIFFTLTLFNPTILPRRTAVIIALGGLGSIFLGAFALLASGVSAQRLDLSSSLLLLRFEGLITGRDTEALSSSGRVSHWENIIDYIAMNPIFGYGQRTISLLEKHAVENFFLQHLSDYGLIGLALFLALLRWLWRSIRTSDLPASPTRDAHRRAGGVLKAILFASFFQWQVNDINTYFQAFPMLAVCAVLFARQMNAARAAQPC